MSAQLRTTLKDIVLCRQWKWSTLFDHHLHFLLGASRTRSCHQREAVTSKKAGKCCHAPRGMESSPSLSPFKNGSVPQAAAAAFAVLRSVRSGLIVKVGVRKSRSASRMAAGRADAPRSAAASMQMRVHTFAPCMHWWRGCCCRARLYSPCGPSSRPYSRRSACVSI